MIYKLFEELTVHLMGDQKALDMLEELNHEVSLTLKDFEDRVHMSEGQLKEHVDLMQKIRFNITGLIGKQEAEQHKPF